MENIEGLTVRAPITLKIKLADAHRVSVADESLRAACLDEQLAEAHVKVQPEDSAKPLYFPVANIVHDQENGRAVYLADEDGTFMVEIMEPDSERKVTTMINASGFEVTARYSDAGWQTVEEMARDADADAFLAAAQA